jgi:hypothetical protein
MVVTSTVRHMPYFRMKPIELRVTAVIEQTEMHTELIESVHAHKSVGVQTVGGKRYYMSCSVGYRH